MHALTRVRRPATISVLALGLLAHGCSRTHYRDDADRETYALLEEATAATPWEVPIDFSLEPVARSRLSVPEDPVDPLLPPPGPFLYSYQLPGATHELVEATDASTAEPAVPPGALTDAPAADDETEILGLSSQPVPESYWDETPRPCLMRMLEFETVRKEYRKLHGEDPPADILDASRKLSLREIVELGLTNSREHQSEKEQLYVSALAVTLERFDYTTKFTPTGNGTDADYANTRSDGRSIQSSQIDSSVAIDKMLATGGTLLARFANNVVLTFDGPDGWAMDAASELLLGFDQRLLQRDVRLEPLIQIERSLVYSARDFARFRRTFFVDLAARYYDILRNYRSIEIEARNYFSQVRTYEQARAEARAGVKNAPNPVDIDQFEQSMLSGRSSLIATCNRLERVLDSLKISVGLPTETPLNIDLSELNELTLRDEVEVAAERVRRWLDLVYDRRDRPNSDVGDILSGDLFLIERVLDWLRLRLRLREPTPDAAELREILGRLRVSAARVEMDRLQGELEIADDPTAGAPVILLYARTSDLIEAMLALLTAQTRLGEQLGRDEETIQPARDRIQEAQAQLDAQRDQLEEVLQDAQQQGLNDLLEAARELLGVLQNLANSLDETNEIAPGVGTDEESQQETARETDRLVEITEGLLEGAQGGLAPISISIDDAMATALVQRFDMMNERGRLADTWRGIKLSADDLKSVINLNAEYSLRTRDNKPVKFSGDDSRARVALGIDLPLNRRDKRNDFRRALIDYQAGLRRTMALEDTIKFDVRDSLRTLDETRIQYPISVTQAALAAEQVINVKLQLAFGIEGVRGFDLVVAQESSRQALISVANARIGYLVDRARLALDLELLTLDKQGLWPQINDPRYQPEPDLVYPEGAGPTYGTIPSFLWVSSDIKRQLDHPLPGWGPAGGEVSVAKSEGSGGE